MYRTEGSASERTVSAPAVICGQVLGYWLSNTATLLFLTRDSPWAPKGAGAQGQGQGQGQGALGALWWEAARALPWAKGGGSDPRREPAADTEPVVAACGDH